MPALSTKLYVSNIHTISLWILVPLEAAEGHISCIKALEASISFRSQETLGEIPLLRVANCTGTGPLNPWGPHDSTPLSFTDSMCLF